MLQQGRKYEAESGYRYGFNGKENDNEVKGEGSQQDYGMRIYDPRIGKFLSVDPLWGRFPWWSAYHYAGNTPINTIDLDGGEVPEDKNKNENEKKIIEYINSIPKSNSKPNQHLDADIKKRIESTPVLTEITTRKGYAQEQLARTHGRTVVEKNHWKIYYANKERESQEFTSEMFKLTDFNDACILVTSITRKNPINLDGTEADGVDVGFAAGGIFIPIVSGSLIKNATGSLIKGSIKVFKSGVEHLEDAVKIGKYGWKGTKAYNEVIKAIQGGGNIIANSQEEALKFLKDAFPDMADETGKVASKYGYRIDNFVEVPKDGLKQGHQGWHINYYDKASGIKGTILVDQK